MRRLLFVASLTALAAGCNCCRQQVQPAACCNPYAGGYAAPMAAPMASCGPGMESYGPAGVITPGVTTGPVYTTPGQVIPGPQTYAPSTP